MNNWEQNMFMIFDTSGWISVVLKTYNILLKRFLIFWGYTYSRSSDFSWLVRRSFTEMCSLIFTQPVSRPCVLNIIIKDSLYWRLCTQRQYGAEALLWANWSLYYILSAVSLVGDRHNILYCAGMIAWTFLMPKLSSLWNHYECLWTDLSFSITWETSIDLDE